MAKQIKIDIHSAETIGLNESILLGLLREEIRTSGVLLKGEKWIAKTYGQWQELLPFWSLTTIKRIFNSLEKQGLIRIEQHGRHRYDRTNWYALLGPKAEAERTEEEEPTETGAPEPKPQETALSEASQTVKEKMEALNFYPLRKEQLKELEEACRRFPVEAVIEALETTAEKSIFAWKYAYKVLVTNGAKPAGAAGKRKIIRTEMLPDWFQRQEESISNVVWTEERLEKKRRLEEVQRKYRAAGE